MTYFYYNIHYYTDPCEIGPPVFWEAEIFLKYVVRMQEMLFQRPKFKKIPSGHAPRSP
jgi:hypothetical protein